MRVRLPISVCCWAAVATALLAPADTHGAPPKSAPDEQAQRASALVEQALTAEAAGDEQTRSEFIKQALELAPKLPSARWAASQVQVRGHWVSLDDAEQDTGKNPIWQQYCQLRSDQEPGAAAEQSLAVWCREHKLAAQARVHWRRVLNSDPENAQALKELHLHWYQDKLLTPAELAERKRQEVQVSKATKVWQPRLVAWRKDIASSHSATAEKARAGIQSIDDPAVIPVFETLLTHNSPDNNDPAFSIEMAHALGKLPVHEAAFSLARLALRARWPETRSEAIKQLSTRELTDYVPYVLGLLRSPIRRTSKISVGPDGNIYCYWRTCQNNFDAEDVRESIEKTIPIPFRNATKELAVQTALAQAQRDEFWKSKQVEDRNAVWASEMQNARELFQANTQTDQGNDLQDWWSWWADYNELNYSTDKPVRAFWQANAKIVYVSANSCFAAGTKVLTQTGLRPIEEIKPGDAVLAQNPQTGELAYQCVLATTIRPPSPLKKLTVGGEEIVTTRGHRFWRDGRGWQMAKHLSAGGLLHTVGGALPIAAIEDAGEDQAYNLVVDSFHTYFVGEHRLLVHDNSAPKPVLGPVPGMSAAEH